LELPNCQVIPIAAQIMSRCCLRCRLAHVKCQSSGESTPCRRCSKFSFHCVKAPLLVPPPPPPPLPLAPLMLPAVPQCLAVPQWTHEYAADSHSSNRVRAAAIAFMAHIPKDPIKLSRINDCVKKKFHKQGKFLTVVQHSNVRRMRLSLADIANDVIVFDGTASHPPPPINPPTSVSNIDVSR
jgi:hypothetical protein